MAFLSDDLGISFNERTFLPSDDLVLPTSCVGVEVELEDVSTSLVDQIPKGFWSTCEDGSLRDRGVEFITNGPLFGKDLISALTQLSDLCDTWHPLLTYRTSVHIHLDMRDVGIEEVRKLFLLYLIFETALFRLFGRRRENLYCLPYHDSDQDLLLAYEALIKGAKLNRVGEYLDRCNKYCALNLGTLIKFGTLEFRHMYGCHDSKKIIDWINLILCLKKYAIEGDFDHRSITSSVSAMTSLGFTREVFGDYIDKLSRETLPRDVYEGARLADYFMTIGEV